MDINRSDLPGKRTGTAGTQLMTVRQRLPEGLKDALRPYVKPLMGTVQSIMGRPTPGRVDFGDLRRTTPLSSSFGYDRGTPVDRYYIDGFLQNHASLIRGRVLEVVDNTYTRRFGGEAVGISDVVDLDSDNPLATFVDDLTVGSSLPSNTFDCFILTQVLQLVYDVPAVLRTAHRVLKPGGALLVTVPGVTQVVERSDDVQDTWYWSLTRRSATRLFEDHFTPGDVTVDVYGNVLSAASFLYGLAAEELKTAELDVKDSRHPLVIGVCAVKTVEDDLEPHTDTLGRAGQAVR